jgi:RNA polymerase sigma-70 factor (ECF subfamily)
VKVDLEAYRSYLLVLARMHLNPRWQTKEGASDVVQKTLLDAHQGLAGFQGNRPGALTAWLRQILARNLTDLARHHTAGKRDARLEQSLHQALEESSIRLEACLAGNDPTPVEQIERNEQVLLLTEALEHLPEDQRRAIELRHLRGLSLKEVAQHLGRSPSAVGGLIFRGLRQMRRNLEANEPTDH